MVPVLNDHLIAALLDQELLRLIGKIVIIDGHLFLEDDDEDDDEDVVSNQDTTEEGDDE